MISHLLRCATLMIAIGAWLPAQAQTPRPGVDLKTAESIRDHCIARARGAKIIIAIAVFDRGGNLVSYSRMDELPTAIGDVAQWKGKSAAVYLTASAETGQWNVPTAPHIATVGGGVPIFDSQGLGLGGVGVSGGSVDFDTECATKAVEAANLRVTRN
jgi:glc operon protein GlcG